MISTPHIPFSLKKFNGPSADYVTPGNLETEYDTISLILKGPADEDAYNGGTEKKLSDIQGQFHCEQFKEWCMPEQAAGYIKAKRHGLL